LGDAGDEGTGVGAVYNTTVNYAAKETYGRRSFAGVRSCFVGDIRNVDDGDEDQAGRTGILLRIAISQMFHESRGLSADARRQLRNDSWASGGADSAQRQLDQHRCDGHDSTWYIFLVDDEDECSCQS